MPQDPHQTISQFRAALESRAIIPPDPILGDGQIHRCDADGKHGRGDAAYILHLDGIPAGGFQNHRDGIGWENWRANVGRTLTPDEERAHHKRLKAMLAARRADEQQRHDHARQRAADLWDSAPPAPHDHPYLIKKAVGGHDLRTYKTALMVPIRDVQGVLLSLQFIGPDGKKRFLSGGQKQGGFHWIGESAETFCIAEGYATAASIHEATGYPVAVAFDAGNLEPVAKVLRARHPKARLIVCADDDHQTPGNPGVTQATAAAKAVHGVLAVPEFRNRPEWATDFNDLARLSGPMAVAVQIDTAAEPDGETLEIIELADVIPEPVRWLWPGRFALGKLSLVAGYPGLGKSQFTASLAAVVTTGGTWPVTGEAAGAPGDVLFLSAEDDPADTIRPRLEAAGADLRRCRIMGSVRGAQASPARQKRRCFNLLDDLPNLERALKRQPARLVVIDPLSAYMGDSRRVDTHKTSDVRSVLAPLVELASANRAAVVGIFHLNKREGSSAMDRINGSGAFVAAARAVWLIAKDKEEKAARVFVQVKNNLAADQDGLKFEIRPCDVRTADGDIPTSCLSWRPERVNIDADEALVGGGWNERRNVVEDAGQFLERFLSTGRHPATDILNAASAAGLSEKSVYRAKKNLRITATKGKGNRQGWVWSLPNKDGQDGQDTHIDA
ncbi:MAG: AAA family ATPase [Candidatus Contendobacter sp.]|nr:MAG: AAA family ATPase [Candidatus Contendobacter sp.]